MPTEADTGVHGPPSSLWSGSADLAGPALADSTIVPDPTLTPGARPNHRRGRDLLHRHPPIPTRHRSNGAEIMMTGLVRYESARTALAAAASVDEVKDVLDIGVAMQIYARQAKDCELIDKATEIRLRAERRLGEMIIAQKKTIGLAKGGQPHQTKSTGSSAEPVALTLAAAGIDKKLSARTQKIAAIPESKFETHLAAAKKQAADALRMTTAERQQLRTEREAELAAKQLALPAKRFGVIYADPPW